MSLSAGEGEGGLLFSDISCLSSGKEDLFLKSGLCITTTAEVAPPDERFSPSRILRGFVVIVVAKRNQIVL